MDNARWEAGAGTKRHTQTRGAWQGVRGRGREGPVKGQRPPGNVHSMRRPGRGRGNAVHQEHNTHRAREHWECRARLEGEAGARLRAQARCYVCRKMSRKPEPKPSQPPAAEAAPPARAVRGYGGPGLVGVKVEVACMQADTAPQPPSMTSSAASAEVSPASSLKSPELVRRELRASSGGAAEGRRSRGWDRGGRRQGRTGRGEWRQDGGGGSGS